MAVTLLLLGFFVGSAFGGINGGFIGLIIASAVWLGMTVFSFYSGDQVLLMASNAKEVTHEVHPQLFNIVEEMTIAANLSKMPKIYIINEQAPNAFATGRNPDHAAVAVTAGLLARLNRDELQGVIAHEISHIIHRDILFVTMAGVMLGAIVIISQIFLRGMFYSSMGSRRRYSSSSSNNGQAQLILMVVAIICAILAPIFAHIMYFALSRKREYLADAGAVRLTRYPTGLADALHKISSNASPMKSANKVTAPMYITNPLDSVKKTMAAKSSGKASLFSTHPPIDKRIEVLRKMSRGASFQDYSDSYRQTVGSDDPIPKSELKQSEAVGLRNASKDTAPKKQQKDPARQVGDIMRMVNGFVFLTCTCGLKMKIPPNFKSKKIKCPRCKKISDLPKK